MKTNTDYSTWKRPDHMPTHVAFIMDGNRRWAVNHSKHPLEGHEAGETRIEPLIDAAIAWGIPYLTFWAFSTENWQRTEDEVACLMSLFRNELDKKMDDFHRKNVRIRMIGNMEEFPRDIQEKTNRWVTQTRGNTRITVTIALGYGGRDEIIRAIRKVHENSKFDIRNLKLTQEEFEKHLDTAGIPDPDLLIRTGGTRRLSGFLLWQIEYAELYFTSVLWPDFSPKEFMAALEEYAKRERKFGK